MKPSSTCYALIATLGASLFALPAASADTLYFIGGGTTTTGLAWGQASSFSSTLDGSGPGASPLATDDVIFSITGASAGVLGMNAGRAANSLTFNAAVANTLMAQTGANTNQQLTIGSGGITINSGAGQVTFGVSGRGILTTRLGASQSWIHNGTNAFSISQSVNLESHTLTLSGSGSGNTTISSAISGSGGVSITRNGDGIVIFSGTNAYTGKTVINAGILSIASDGNLGAAPGSAVADQLSLNGGTLRNTAGTVININRGITLGANGGAIDVTGGNLSYNGIITGSGSLAISSTDSTVRTLSLGGSNTYSGVTYVNSGTLQISDGSALGSTVGNTIINAGGRVFAGGTFNNKSTAEAFSIAGAGPDGTTGAIHVGGSAAAGFSGAITLSADATLRGDGGTTNNYSGGIDTAGNTLTFSSNGTFNVNTAGISGSGGTVIRSSTGVLNFNAVNSHTGATILNQGTTSVGASGVLSGSTAALAVNNTNTGTGNNTILNLGTGSNTTVGSLSGSIATPSSGTNTATINIRNSRTLTVNQTSDATYEGVIAETGGTGAGFTLGSGSTHTLTLIGTNTYSGGTTIEGGTLALTTNAAAAGTGGISLTGSNAAGLSIASGITIANDITFSNSNASSGVSRGIAASGNFNTGTSGVLKSSFADARPDTTAAFLEGASTSGTTLAMSFSSSSGASNDSARRTDIFSVTGTGGDTFVVQLNASGLAADSFLAFLSGGTWIPAGSTFHSASWTTGTYGLGAYGFDSATNSAWAVVNSGGSFAVIPEPTTALAGLLLGLGLLRRRRTERGLSCPL